MTEPMPRSILPMQLQIGDRFTHEEGEWEVTHRPSRGGSRARSRSRKHF